MLRLSLHVGNQGRDGSFALYTESAIEFLAVEVVATDFWKVGQQEADSFLQRLESLPGDVAVENVIAKEEELWADWHISYATRAMNGGEWNANWINSTLNLPDESEQVVAIKRVVAGRPENLARLAAAAKPFYQQAGRVATLPRDQYDREWPQLIQRARAENPLASLGLTNITALRPRWDETQARRVLFREAVRNVYHHGDPLKTEGCSYELAPDGCILRSSALDLANSR